MKAKRAQFEYESTKASRHSTRWRCWRAFRPMVRKGIDYNAMVMDLLVDHLIFLAMPGSSAIVVACHTGRPTGLFLFASTAYGCSGFDFQPCTHTVFGKYPLLPGHRILAQ